MEKELVDVVIVGAGPAGIAAAITLARAGKEVVVLERGAYPGAKNVFGGAIYTQPTQELYPDFWKSAPLERLNVEHRFAILGEHDSTVVGYRNSSHSNSYTVLRSKWDRWCAQQAQEEGAYVINETLVKELVVENGKVVGVRTENEDFYARITIVADGVNSLLAKQLGMRKQIKPENVALGVKEVISLPADILKERFNVQNDQGVIYTIIGGPMSGMVSLGYIYTNKESVVIGLGASLEELSHQKIRPYDLLNELKKHPTIAPLIEGGKLLEYSAHLIPEGGYKKLPQLCKDGVMFVGDAAMLVNNVHWEGTNLAMISGKHAAEAAIEALDKSNYSSKALSTYTKRLQSSFVMKDLRSYRDVMPFAQKNKDAFMKFYPQKINEFMNLFLSVDSIPKKEKYLNFIFGTIKERTIPKLFCDLVKFIKLGGGIFF